MKRSKKKKKVIKGRKRPSCGLCGSKTNLTRTECCGQWICDDEDQYVPFSYARNSCYRNHSRYTLCGYHFNEGHEGDWKTCIKCREDFSHELEMYVEYGTNEYNFEKLPAPPAFELTYCSGCGKRIVMAEGGYTVRDGKYTCFKCGGNPLAEMQEKMGLEVGEEEIYEDDDVDDLPDRLGPEDVDDIPAELRGRYERLSGLLTAFAERYVNMSFGYLCLDMAISLCVQCPEVVGRGKPEGWAGGIVHALGMVNFLFDAKQELSIDAGKVREFFGVSQGTIQSKSKQIRDLFGIFPMDPEWSMPEQLVDNPLVWIVEMDGLLVDLRHAPLTMQRRAVDEGLIPMLPGEMEQRIREVIEVINAKGTGKNPEPRKGKLGDGKPRGNIRIMDYLGPEKKDAAKETLPLFDTKKED